MLDGMLMSALGAEHAMVHSKMAGRYQPAPPNDLWFALKDRPGSCHGGWYRAYLQAYRLQCQKLGIELGKVADSAFARFGVHPCY